MKIKKIEDIKEKQIWIENLADNYLDFIDWNILYQPSQELIWIYDTEDNDWVKRSVDKKNSIVQPFYTELFNFIRLNGLYENRFTNSSRIFQEIEKIKALMFSNKKHIAPEFPNDKYHRVQDGVFNTETGELLPFDKANGPEYWTTHKYPFTLGDVDFKKFNLHNNKYKNTLVYKFFNGATEWDKELLIMIGQMYATAISPYRYPVMYIMTGPQGTAKSTTLQLLGSLVGQDRVGVSRLEDFATKKGDQFEMATATSGNKINISEEIAEERIDSSTLKTLISEDYQRVRKMHTQGYKAPIHTRFYGTSNNILNFDSIDGIDRRIKYIVLERRIPSEEIDIDLVSKINKDKDELKILFILAYQGLVSIQENMKKEDLNWLAGFYQSSTSVEAKEEVRESSRPTHVFFREIELEYVGGENAVVFPGLYEAFKTFAEEEGHSGSAKMSSMEFHKQLKEYARFKFNMTPAEAKKIKRRYSKKVGGIQPWVAYGFTANRDILNQFVNGFDEIIIEENEK